MELRQKMWFGQKTQQQIKKANIKSHTRAGNSVYCFNVKGRNINKQNKICGLYFIMHG